MDQLRPENSSQHCLHTEKSSWGYLLVVRYCNSGIGHCQMLNSKVRINAIRRSTCFGFPPLRSYGMWRLHANALRIQVWLYKKK